MTAMGVVSSSREAVFWPALDPWHDTVLERVSGAVSAYLASLPRLL